MLGAMRVDYHQYRRPALIWSLLGVAVVGAARGAFCSADDQRRAALDRASAASRMQPSELAKLAAILFAAALLERRMHRINDVGYALLPIGIVTGRPGRAHPARA